MGKGKEKQEKEGSKSSASKENTGKEKKEAEENTGKLQMSGSRGIQARQKVQIRKQKKKRNYRVAEY